MEGSYASGVASERKLGRQVHRSDGRGGSHWHAASSRTRRRSEPSRTPQKNNVGLARAGVLGFAAVVSLSCGDSQKASSSVGGAAGGEGARGGSGGSAGDPSHAGAGAAGRGGLAGSGGSSVGDGGAQVGGGAGSSTGGGAGSSAGGAGGAGASAGGTGADAGFAGQAGAGGTTPPTCMGVSAPSDVVGVSFPSATANYACGPFPAAPLSTRLGVTGRLRSWPTGATKDYSGFGVYETLPAPETLTPPAAGGPSNVYTTLCGSPDTPSCVDAGFPNLLHWGVWPNSFSGRATFALYVRFAGLADFTTYDPPGVTDEVLALHAGAVGEEVGDAEDALIGRVLDCDNRPVANALVTVSAAGHAPGIFYHDASLPTRARTETSQDGRFFAPHLVPDAASPTYAVEAWGFTSDEDLQAGCSGLRRLGKFEVPVSGHRVLMLDLFPTEGSGARPSGLLESGHEICRPSDVTSLASYTTLTGVLALRGLAMIPGTGTFQCANAAPELLANADLTPLSSVTAVGGLAVSGQQTGSLDDLQGLEGLVRVNDSVLIEYNQSLTSLDGLEALTSIGLSLRITGNSLLANVRGLSSLISLGGDLAITDNPSLPTCEAEALRDQLVASGFTGAVTIRGNDDAGSCQ